MRLPQKKADMTTSFSSQYLIPTALSPTRSEKSPKPNFEEKKLGTLTSPSEMGTHAKLIQLISGQQIDRGCTEFSRVVQPEKYRPLKK